MKTFQIVPYAVVLVLGLAIGYAIGVNAKREPASPKPIVQKTPESPDEPDTIAGIPAESPVTTESTQPGEAASAATQTPASAPAPQPAAPVVPASLPFAGNCFTGDEAVSKELTWFAEKTERDSLWYGGENDCSGIFLKVAAFCQKRCDGYVYPDKSTRDTRALARWFYDRNNLVIVNDAAANRNLIRPGAVLFYGYQGKRYNNLTIDQLKTSIQHIGTVTEVKKDANGDVEGYILFHGRTHGKIASRTHYHNLKPAKLGMPPLGNWNQQLVAIGYVFTPKG